MTLDPRDLQVALARRQRQAQAVDSIRTTLELGDVWADLPMLLGVSLSQEERERLAIAALKSLPADIGFLTAQAAFQAVEHLPPFDAEQDEKAALGWARSWAEQTSQMDLKAHAIACFERMAKETRAAFLDWIAGRKR